MTTFLALILALSFFALLGALAVLKRGSGPGRLPAAVTVPAGAPRQRRRSAR